MSQEHEYEPARDLLAPLDAEPELPSAVDVRRAIADGRRRVRIRRVAGVGAVAAVTALAVAAAPLAWDAVGGSAVAPPAASGSPAEPAPTPALPASCEMAPLPVPDGTYQSLVTGADPTGRYVLGRSYATAGSDSSNIVSGVRVQPLIWADGGYTEVELPGTDPVLQSVNSRGVAVGSSFRSDNTAMPFAYAGGEVTPLDGEDLYAVAINENDVIVGHHPTGEGPPVVWRSPSAPAEELSIPGPGWSVRALDVDADGTVVGYGSNLDDAPDAVEQAFVWHPDGTREDLPLPTVDGEDAAGFWASAIHDGVVTGMELIRDGDGSRFHLVSYDLSTGEFTPLSASGSYAYAWNRHGWMVGGGADGPALWAGSDAQVPLPLPDAPEADDLPPGPRFDLAAVSDDGRMVVGQVEVHDQDAPLGDGGQPMVVSRAVAWHCD